MKPFVLGPIQTVKKQKGKRRNQLINLAKSPGVRNGTMLMRTSHQVLMCILMKFDNVLLTFFFELSISLLFLICSLFFLVGFGDESRSFSFAFKTFVDDLDSQFSMFFTSSSPFEFSAFYGNKEDPFAQFFTSKFFSWAHTIYQLFIFFRGIRKLHGSEICLFNIGILLIMSCLHPKLKEMFMDVNIKLNAPDNF